MSKTFKNHLKQIDYKRFSLLTLVRVAYFLPLAIANLVKSGTFASTVPALLPIRTACGSFDKKTFSVNDNTPPRLTSVAHLGGFSFLWGL
ncbi:hypothetical protein [Cecembia calidifontis]|uniref:Uncharacterized protein n=1 Tax=Cecembia calidifontis TaxID=1187080 RepID=A0A4Q7PBB2_9BACT|nr:hypothetical protein [Cecembia calidifontis]RZS97534.1 hypothetical protein BC751_3146 [Cecembia calidifontis]